jgi:3-oxoacyl-[acyl-carrier-protein] synthase II
VNIGSGIGSFEDVVDTALAYDKGVRPCPLKTRRSNASQGYRAVSPLFVPRLLINLAAGHVSMRHGFTGASLAPATACTTGTHAVADALRLLRNAENSPDAPSVVLAGAAEACVAPLAMAGFARARSLATPFDDYRPGAADDEGAAARAASRPFDAARTGFVLAEGAAVLVLETLAHALARGVPPSRICAELAGAGCASDAWHATAPHPGGRGARLAMERALRDARADPRDVDWVCAHATGTRAGDAAENRAVRAVMLGDGGDQGRFKDGAADVNVSSVKGALGHLLGAAGAVEAAFAALAVREDVLPPTVNLDVPGDGDGGWDMNYVARVKQHRRVDVAVSNSAGFGGTCASVVFRKFRM